jgi:hypothetical protein
MGAVRSELSGGAVRQDADDPMRKALAPPSVSQKPAEVPRTLGASYCRCVVSDLHLLAMS